MFMTINKIVTPKVSLIAIENYLLTTVRMVVTLSIRLANNIYRFTNAEFLKMTFICLT